MAGLNPGIQTALEQLIKNAIKQENIADEEADIITYSGIHHPDLNRYDIHISFIIKEGE